MKKSIIILFLIIKFPIFLYAEEPVVDINKYRTIINEIIYNCENIVQNNQSSKLVYEAFNLAMEYVRNNNISFIIDVKLNMVLSGMEFYIHESGEIGFVFGVKFLDTYTINSSIHYSILMHEYRHLHDYLTNKENYLRTRNDEKEKYLYEMDAIRIEAEFIKYYLYGKYRLSKFEEYILTSLEFDNLESASIMILKESRDIFLNFYEMEIDYFDGQKSRDNIIDELIINGNDLIRGYNINDVEYISFSNYIRLYTYNKYLIKTLVFLMDAPTMTWGEVFGKYPKIGNIYNSIVEIQNKDREKQNQYLSSVYKYWEDEITGDK
jgi:hypothetical protein